MNTRRASRTPRLERWSRMRGLIGGVGGNHPAPCRKSTPANCGPSRFQRTPSNMLDTVMMARCLTGPRRGSSLPMPWVARTAICPTFGYGPTTPPPSLNNTVCQIAMPRRSPTMCSKERLGWMKTPCPGNWPTWFRAVWPTCWICKDLTTPWMPLAHRPWRPFWTRAACCRHGRST